MNTEPTRKYLVTSCCAHRHQDTRCVHLYSEVSTKLWKADNALSLNSET